MEMSCLLLSCWLLAQIPDAGSPAKPSGPSNTGIPSWGEPPAKGKPVGGLLQDSDPAKTPPVRDPFDPNRPRSGDGGLGGSGGGGTGGSWDLSTPKAPERTDRGGGAGGGLFPDSPPAKAPADRGLSPDADRDWPSRRPADAPLRPVEGPLRSEPPGGLPPLDATRRPTAKLSPQEHVARLIALPPESALAGRGLSLFELFGAVHERKTQLEAVRAYWRLARAVGLYRVSCEEYAHLRRLRVRGGDEGTIRAAIASALAARQAAEQGVARAQAELGEGALASVAGAMPLPADVPFVGAYLTRYEEIAARRGLPPRARLMHQVLPVVRSALETRIEAVVAADDCLQAAIDAYDARSGELGAVLAALAELGRQRRGLVALADEYNQRIAEYALGVAPAGTPSEDLTAMLIGPGSTPAPAPTARPPARTPVNPGGFGETPGGTGGFGQPPTAAPHGILAPGAGGPSAGAPASSILPDRSTSVTDVGERSILVSGFEPARGDGAGQGRLRAEPIPSVEPRRQLVQRLAADDFVRGGSGRIEGDSPAAQVAAGVFAVPRSGQDARAEVGLEECLRRKPATERRAVIEAYWTARQRLAEYQVLLQQEQFLEPLQGAAAARSSRPEEMLRVRAARLSAKADLLERQAALLEAQFELTRLAGRPLEGVWAVPSTEPLTGPYRLSLESLRAEVAGSPAVRRLAAAIPALAKSLDQRAAAVIDADRARVAAAGAYRDGAGSLDAVLTCVACQTLETIAFAQSVTSYNQAIGQYALAAIPPEAPVEKLISALVMPKGNR